MTCPRAGRSSRRRSTGSGWALTRRSRCGGSGSLFDVYIEGAVPPDFDDDEAAFNSGLDWARHAPEGRSALLMRERLAAVSGFRAFDTLVDMASREIPERAWAVLLGSDPALGSESLLGVTMAASSSETAQQAAALAVERTDSLDHQGLGHLVPRLDRHSRLGDAASASRYLAEVVASARARGSGLGQGRPGDAQDQQ